MSSLFARFCCIAGIVVSSLSASAGEAAGQISKLPPAIKSEIDSIARGGLSHQHLAGLSIAIAKDGAILYAQGYGHRDIANRRPATPQTIYNIASMSKQFTAACVLLLHQDGKLNIDDSLSKFLPDFPNADKITLRQLLNHTSGIADYLDLIDNNHLTMAKALAALKKAPLKFRPGSTYSYSNSNYILLGLVVNKVSGMTFDDFLRERIFTPLALTSTSIGTAPKDLPNGAVGYTVSRGRTVPTTPQDASQLDFSDGGVNSSVLDLVTWDHALDSGRVLDKGALEMMFAPSPNTIIKQRGYGLGVRIDRIDGHREVVHAGEWTGYAGENATFPDDGFAIIMLSNTDGFDEDSLIRQVFELFYPRVSQRNLR